MCTCIYVHISILCLGKGLHFCAFGSAGVQGPGSRAKTMCFYVFLRARSDASQEPGSRTRGARIQGPGGQDLEARGPGSGGKGARIRRREGRIRSPGLQDAEARGPRSRGQGRMPGSDDKIQRSGSPGARRQWS